MSGRKRNGKVSHHEIAFEGVEQKLTPAKFTKTAPLENITVEIMDCDDQAPNNCFFTAVFFILLSTGCTQFKNDLQLRKYCINTLICFQVDHGDKEFTEFLSDMGAEDKEDALNKLISNNFIDFKAGCYLLGLTKLKLPHITIFALVKKDGSFRLHHGLWTFTGKLEKVAAIAFVPYSKRGTVNNHFANVLVDNDFFPQIFEHWAVQKLPDGESRKNAEILKARYSHLHKFACNHYGRMSLPMAHRCIESGIENGIFNSDGTYKGQALSVEDRDEEEAIRRSLESKKEEDLRDSDLQAAIKASLDPEMPNPEDLVEAERVLKEALACL